MRSVLDSNFRVIGCENNLAMTMSRYIVVDHQLHNNIQGSAKSVAATFAAVSRFTVLSCVSYFSRFTGF